MCLACPTGICPELFAPSRRNLQMQQQLAGDVSLQRYNEHLHKDGKKLIADWLTRGIAQYSCKPEDSFEPMIYTWIAFNGWASCVTGQETDRKMIEALSLSEDLCERFDNLLFNRTFRGGAETFQTLWPVFKAQELHHDNIRYEPKRQRTERRADRINYYLQELTKARPVEAERTLAYAPSCFERHVAENTPIPPLDLAHALSAIYTIRCNLFHGQKGKHLENDQQLVYYAFRVLSRFLRSFPSNWEIVPRSDYSD